jgi:hypothetical protein
VIFYVLVAVFFMLVLSVKLSQISIKSCFSFFFLLSCNKSVAIKQIII